MRKRHRVWESDDGLLWFRPRMEGNLCLEARSDGAYGRWTDRGVLVEWVGESRVELRSAAYVSCLVSNL